ncbi:MAG: hypothetical protein LBC27_09735, partial [Spirochaetaceae bacterium]|nr:hypothetical protein [Spirochaetaceae bacterium]
MKYRLLAAFYVFLLLIPAICAYSDNGSGIISAVSVSGLKRTKLHTVEAVLEQFIGRNADTLDLNTVYAAILDMGVLEPVSIAIADDTGIGGKILYVVVREKWSIFPLPLLFVNAEGVNGGVFFVDTNAFGLNDKFFVGGMYGAEGWLLNSGYMHSGNVGAPGGMISGAFSQGEKRDKNASNEDIRRFKSNAVKASAGVSYSFNSVLSSRLGLSYQQIMLQDSDSPLEEPESGARTIDISVEAALRKSEWDGFLLSEKSLSTEYTFTASLEDYSLHKIGLRGVYEESLLPGLKANVHTGLLYHPDAPPLFESSPYAAQVNILPPSLSARHYAGLSAGLEKYLFKISAGALSALISYQAVFSEGPILGSRFDHG